MAFKDPQRNKEYNRMYYEKHKQERKDYLREYYKQNSEKIKNYQKEYRSIPENKEKIKERDRECREDNTEIISQKRKIYDQFGHEGLKGRGFSGFSGFEDIFSSFGDIFDDFFEPPLRNSTLDVNTLYIYKGRPVIMDLFCKNKNFNCISSLTDTNALFIALHAAERPALSPSKQNIISWV